jgi:hypothetical protein
MMRGRRYGNRALLLALLVVAGSRAQALPIVRYSVNDLGGGLFAYRLSVTNAGGSEALSGLNVLNGASVFGLDGSSSIGAPSGWMFFEPLPPLIDDLVYFSLSPGADVPVDGSRAGFSFRSTTDPDTLGAGDFAVEGIGAESGSQIPLGDAMFVPEPALGVLLVAALVAPALRAGRRPGRDERG